MRHSCRHPLLLLGLIAGAIVFSPVAWAQVTTDSLPLLVLTQPKLYAAPSVDTATTQTDWLPGRPLAVLDRQMGTGPTSGTAIGWLQVRSVAATGWLPEVFLAPPPQPMDPSRPIPIGKEQVDRTHTLPPHYQPPDLVEVGPGYEKGRTYHLRSEAADHLEAMISAAAVDDIRLFIVSGFRPWSSQQELYEKRVRASGWGESTVARPGQSEHQLGTAVDLTDGDPAHELNEAFGSSPAGRWLAKNAWMYGFVQSFTRQNQARTGISPEPWHYRYWGIGQALTRKKEAERPDVPEASTPTSGTLH